MPDIAPAATPSRNAERILQRLQWHVVRRLDGILQGDYRSLFRGSGLDLAGVREYQPHDDVRYMDWNVTARLGVSHVRQYFEDREVTAWLLLDVSGSMDYGTTVMSKRDLLVDLAVTIAMLLTRHGNRVGAMLFDDGVGQVVPPRTGRRQALVVTHQLIRPDRPAVHRVTDLARSLAQAATTLRRRSLVFVVSDFLAPPGWERPLSQLAERHELVAVRLRDPREEDLPDVGWLTVEDAETGEQMEVDTGSKRFRDRFRALAAERQEGLTRTFARHGVDTLTLSTESDLVRELARFALRRKRRRGGAPGVYAMKPALRSGGS